MNLVLFLLNLDIMYEINVYVNIFLVFVICMWLFIKRGNLKFFLGCFSGWLIVGCFNEEFFVIECWMLDIGRNNLIL